MKRRIVQIAMADGARMRIFAVADDGTVWVMHANDPAARWEQIAPLPDAPDDYEIVDTRADHLAYLIGIVNKYHNLGDATYAVRERFGHDAIDGVPYTGDSWLHPIVTEYSNAAIALSKLGVIP